MKMENNHMLSSLSYFVFSGFRFFFYSIGSEDSSSVRKQSLFFTSATSESNRSLIS